MSPRLAAISFSFKPPISVTCPRNVISPVIATSFRTDILVKLLIIAIIKGSPAEGPSLGVAPSGR